MIILFHVLAACAGIVMASLAAISPSAVKLRAGYICLCVTLGSGVYMMVVRHLAILATCESGLTYLSVMLALLTVAYRRLNRARALE